MIPLRLTIKNFLSYGADAQTINFEPYNLICLSGKNGHGKSALLDAMTWSIWGQARKIGGASKPDAGVIRIGAKSATVVFDFEINQKVYRVKREATLTSSKIVSWLDFGLLQENDHSYVSLTTKTIRDTQDLIDKTIGLSFETFVNSTFLRQGNANEFSKKTPKERKDLVASILGLDNFDDLRKSALLQIKYLNTQLDSRHALSSHFTDIILRKKEVEDTLFGINHEIEKNQLEYQKNLDGENLLQSLLTEVAQKEFIKVQLESNKASLQRVYDDFYASARVLRDHLRNQKRVLFNSSLDKLGYFDALEKKIADLRFQVEFAYQHERIFFELDQKRALHEKKLLDEWILVHDDLFKTKNEFEKKYLLAEAEYIRQNDLCKKLISELDNLNLKIKLLEDQVSEQKKNLLLVENLKFQLERYRNKYIKINSLRLDSSLLLNQTNSTSICPTCFQHLDETSLIRVHLSLDRINKRNDRINLFLQNITIYGKLLSERLNCLSKNEQLYIAHLNDLKNLSERKNSILIEIKSLQEAIILFQNSFFQQDYKNIIDQYNRHVESKKNIFLDEFLDSLNQSIKDAQNKSKNLVLLKNDLHLMQEVYNTRLSERHLGENNKIADITRDLYSQIAQMKSYRVQIKSLEHQISDLEKACLSSAEYEGQLVNVRNVIFNLKRSLEGCAELKGRFTQELDVIVKTEHEKQTIDQQVGSFQKEIDDYKIIAQAFSKDGLQALLIEEAIPEIEAEANTLLSRLTDNTAQLLIDPIRDLKNGGIKETLDIKISDQVGIRSYEMFSGGEAFRIDFALRIALSKLLARRSGAMLQTLIIDEGFGSQDDDGLALIMDCLYKIQDDFSKIIIVSHLPSMKDQFPVHFNIMKNSQGSFVSVTEQG
jgi:exonuclease SbcC